MLGVITTLGLGGIIGVFEHNPKEFIKGFVDGVVETFIIGLGVVLIGALYEKLRHKK